MTRALRAAAAALFGAAALVASTVAAGAVTRATPASATPAPLLAFEAHQFVLHARSMRVRGDVNQVTARYKIDLCLFANGDSSGSVTINKAGARILVIPPWFYIRGSAGFWTKVFGVSPSDATTFAGEWIAKPLTSITGLGSAISMAHMRNSFDLSDILGLTRLGTKTVAREKAVGIAIPGKGDLWLSTTRKPRPIAFQGTNNGNNLNITFSGWGKGKVPRRPSGTKYLSTGRPA